MFGKEIRAEMAQCGGVPIHDEYPMYSVSMNARISGKK
jgi:hypothetical protein